MSRRADDCEMTFLSVISGMFGKVDNGAGTTARQTGPRLVRALAASLFEQAVMPWGGGGFEARTGGGHGHCRVSP